MVKYHGIAGKAHKAVAGKVANYIKKQQVNKTTWVNADNSAYIKTGKPVYWNQANSPLSNVKIGGGILAGVSAGQTGFALNNPNKITDVEYNDFDYSKDVYIVGNFSQGDYLRGNSNGDWEITTQANAEVVVLSGGLIVYVQETEETTDGCIIRFLAK